MFENPYAVLGVEVGATLAQIKVAFRKLAKNCHPDWHPDDPEATEKFRRIAGAYEAILALRKRGGTGKRAEDGTGAPPTEPPPRAGPSWVLWEVNASAGAGKTREWANQVSQPPDRRRMVDDPAGITWPPGRPHRIILASISIDLLTETAKALAEFGAGNVTLIHSRVGEAAQTVRQKLGKYFASLKAGQDAILLCTHAAVMMLPVEWSMAAKRGGPERVLFNQSGWDLTIDEAPDIISFLERSWPETHSVITRHVMPIPYRGDLLRLTPKDEVSERRLHVLAQGGQPNRDDGYTSFAEPAAAIVDPTRMVLVSRAQWLDLIATTRDGRYSRSADKLFLGALDLAVMLRPELFQHYRSATMMGARLDRTMAHVLWAKLSNVEFRPHPLQARLVPRHTAAQGERLRIYHAFDGRVTRQDLSRKAKDGRTMFRSMCDGIATFFAGVPFIWTAPLARPGSQHGVDNDFFAPSKAHSQAFAPALRLPGRTHGLNKFRKYDNAALLSVVNCTPNQYGMLGAIGLSDAEINRAFGFNVVYQDALRCSLRDRDARGPVTIVVPDRATAEDLAEDFPGCRVETLPDHLVPALAEKRRPGPQRSGSATSSTDRVRAKRARDRAAKERADDAAKDA